jgi:hypothetical protein
MPVAKLYALAAALLVGSLGAAAAQGSVNVYCSVQVEWCQAIATNFEKATGTRVNMTQKGSGETLAQVRAEAQNPKGDVWFGGTGDPHLVAAEEGLTEAYDSPAAKDLHDWALRRRPGGAGRPAPRPGRRTRGRILASAGGLGMAALGMQAWLIGFRGWTYPGLATALGDLGDRQFGIGLGGTLTFVGLLLLLTEGLELLGRFGGDRALHDLAGSDRPGRGLQGAGRPGARSRLSRPFCKPDDVGSQLPGSSPASALPDDGCSSSPSCSPSACPER